MDTPTPTDPAAALADTPRIVALIVAVFEAFTEIDPAQLSMLLSICALITDKMTLVAEAPAPLTATPAPPPNPAAAAAAAEIALIVASSIALTNNVPAVVVRSSTLLTKASMTLLISL